jgi:hypothetical protein
MDYLLLSFYKCSSNGVRCQAGQHRFWGQESGIEMAFLEKTNRAIDIVTLVRKKNHIFLGRRNLFIDKGPFNGRPRYIIPVKQKSLADDHGNDYD